MNPEQVAAFIAALNQAQPYVPPIIFQTLAGNPISKTLEAIANGLLQLEIKPHLPDEAHKTTDTK